MLAWFLVIEKDALKRVLFDVDDMYREKAILPRVRRANNIVIKKQCLFVWRPARHR